LSVNAGAGDFIAFIDYFIACAHRLARNNDGVELSEIMQVVDF